MHFALLLEQSYLTCGDTTSLTLQGEGSEGVTVLDEVFFVDIS